jgi:orotidine-5'-phosphate decarboxylase
LRKSCGDAFVLVTPGIRSASAKTDDQRRILTPEEAVINGSNYLVIGRPITRALDPVAALKLINDDILSVICT